jgi:ArsR family transcriptional regulator
MDADQFNRISRALADPRRMELLERIARDKEVGCAVLASESRVSQPTISHHLKELSTAGLINPRRESKFCFYRLDRKVWAEYLAEMRRRVPVTRKSRIPAGSPAIL